MCYVLNGMKHFITNAGIAHVNTIFATTERARARAASAPSSSRVTGPASSWARSRTRWAFAARRPASWCFEDCEIPAENLLGKEGDGFKIALATLDRTRPGIAAQALGIAQGALDLAVKYRQAARAVRQADHR